MHQYPATIVSLDTNQVTIRIDSTGHLINLQHSAHNAVPPSCREIGVKGVIVFPKAPPHFRSLAA